MTDNTLVSYLFIFLSRFRQWESYYLGIAPSPETVGSDLASPEQIAAANKLELARGAGQRYLVQRWEDGTPCDKTAQPRKIEVQVRDSFPPNFPSIPVRQSAAGPEKKIADFTR